MEKKSINDDCFVIQCNNDGYVLSYDDFKPYLLPMSSMTDEQKGEYAFCLRGWGYLTGTGGLNLSKDIAKNLQDEFISYILSRLNNKTKID